MNAYNTVGRNEVSKFLDELAELREVHDEFSLTVLPLDEDENVVNIVLSSKQSGMPNVNVSQLEDIAEVFGFDKESMDVYASREESDLKYPVHEQALVVEGVVKRP